MLSLRLLCLAVTAALTMLPAPAAAASAEAQVKAAYLYKLASFVRWPPEVAPRGAFRFCVFGRSDVADVLEELVRGQQVAGRPATVERLGQDPARVRNCHVLMLGGGSESARRMLDASVGLPILTVSDRNRNTWGGAVEFIIRDGKVRFVINRGDASSRGLELSSKLIDVAVEVRR